MKALTIRNVDARLAEALKREVDRRGTSLNQTVLDLLWAQLGLRGERPSNGLARLAGTWTDAELAEFEAATREFDAVDAELWS